MNFLVAYNHSRVARAALSMARDHAQRFNAKVFVMTSMGGGEKATPEAIKKVENRLESAKQFIREKEIECETYRLVQGRSPGEDIVWFVKENEIDLVFIGIEKKSRTEKIILGSTAQFVILKSQCPVTTVKSYTAAS